MDAIAAVLTRLRLTGDGSLLTRIPARPAGVILLCLATLLTAWTVVPRTGTETVLVTARDLTPGTSLSSSDVREVRYPPDLVPPDSVQDVAAVDGAVTGGAISSGTPLTAAALLGPDLSLREPGTVHVPTVFGDPQTVSVIRTGHRLRVYSSGDVTSSDIGSGRSPADAAEDDGAESDSAAVPAPESHGALIEDAVVAGVHRSSDGLSQGTAVVTLEVTQEEAAALARHAGAHLSFALLN